MARAGFCDQCRETVWLASDGSCPRGHTADHIQGAFEAYPHRPESPAPARQSDWAGAVVVMVALGILGAFFLCGVLAAIAIPTFEASRATASQRACFVNQRAIYGAAQTYQVENGKLPGTIDDIVKSGLLRSAPTCPAGGGYEWNPHTGRTRCTLHGAAPIPPARPNTQVSSLK